MVAVVVVVENNRIVVVAVVENNRNVVVVVENNRIVVMVGVEYNIIVVAMVVIITLFKSQIILAEHECSTNWGDCKSNKSNQINQIKCWFWRRGENRSTLRKTSRSRVENQQTQPTYDAGSGNRTRDTLVEGGGGSGGRQYNCGG